MELVVFVALVFVLVGLLGLLRRYGHHDGLHVYEIRPDDESMRAAESRARQTLDRFLTALRSPAPNHTGFAIKARFSDGHQTEHIWLEALEPTSGGFAGILGNIPEAVAVAHDNRRVRVEREAVSDWMYLEGDILVGGYTIRVHFFSQPEPVREQLARSLPFRITESSFPPS